MPKAYDETYEGRLLNLYVETKMRYENIVSIIRRLFELMDERPANMSDTLYQAHIDGIKMQLYHILAFEPPSPDAIIDKEVLDFISEKARTNTGGEE